jgi:hypothetical protein
LVPAKKATELLQLSRNILRGKNEWSFLLAKQGQTSYPLPRHASGTIDLIEYGKGGNERTPGTRQHFGPRSDLLAVEVLLGQYKDTRHVGVNFQQLKNIPNCELWFLLETGKAHSRDEYKPSGC